MKFLFSIISGLMFSLLIHGCVDENIVPNSGTVGVHVLDKNGFPGRFYKGPISFNQHPIAMPDAYGNAYFNNVSSPYYLFLKFFRNDTLVITYYYVVCDNISNNENYIIMPDVNSDSYNTCIANIQFPPVPGGKKGLLKFISTENFYDLKIPIIDEQQHSASGIIFFPINTNSIKGKFIFFVVTMDETIQTIVSYEKFGVKDIVLNANTTVNLTFEPGDVNFNPNESSVTYHVKNLYPSDSSYVALSFDGYNSNSDLFVYGTYGSFDNLIIVPETLPLNFKIKICAESEVYENRIQKKWVLSEPGANIFIDNSVQPRLITPAYAKHNVEDSSVVRFSPVIPGGIYRIKFSFYSSDVSNYYDESFYTEKNCVSLAELKNKGLIFPKNTVIEWCVEEFPNFNSLNEFFSSPYIQNPNYNSNIYSESWFFITTL